MMVGRRGVIVMLVLVVLAGCNSGLTAAPSTSTTTTADTATPVPTTESGTQSTTTATTTTPSQLNPWDAAVVQVFVEAPPGGRNYSQITGSAIEYWNTNRGVAPYDTPPRLEQTESPTGPYVRVVFEGVVDCEGSIYKVGGSIAYCTQTLSKGDSAPPGATITVTTRYNTTVTQELVTRALAGLYTIPTYEADTHAEIPEGPVLRDPFVDSEVTVVAIENEDSPQRNIEPLVADALAWWRSNDDQYGSYTTEWVLKPNATDPDVVVHYVDTVTYCGIHEDQEETLGCADVLTDQTERTRPARVWIQTGFTDDSTRSIIKHEFGHIYGVPHGSIPPTWMEATYDVDELPKTDARDKANPWILDPVTIAIDDASYDNPDRIRSDLTHVVSYFNEHGPRGFRLALVEDPSEAAVVVRNVRASESDCLDPGYASCGMPYGYSVDADRPLEEYDGLVIHTDDLPPENVAWHVGYWIDTTVTPDTTAEYWDDPSSDDRDNWW